MPDYTNKFPIVVIPHCTPDIEKFPHTKFKVQHLPIHETSEEWFHFILLHIRGLPIHTDRKPVLPNMCK